MIPNNDGPNAGLVALVYLGSCIACLATAGGALFALGFVIAAAMEAVSWLMS